MILSYFEKSFLWKICIIKCIKSKINQWCHTAILSSSSFLCFSFSACFSASFFASCFSSNLLRKSRGGFTLYFFISFFLASSCTYKNNSFWNKLQNRSFSSTRDSFQIHPSNATWLFTNKNNMHIIILLKHIIISDQFSGSWYTIISQWRYVPLPSSWEEDKCLVTHPLGMSLWWRIHWWHRHHNQPQSEENKAVYCTQSSYPSAASAQ